MKWIFLLALPILGCAHKAPTHTGTTVALSGSLQRQARSAEAAQGASRAIGKHLDGLGNDLSRVDSKANVILEWVRQQK